MTLQRDTLERISGAINCSSEALQALKWTLFLQYLRSVFSFPSLAC